MSNAPCYDECDKALQQAEFFFSNSLEDTCHSGSFLQAYSSCAQCVGNLGVQTAPLAPTNLHPVLHYCRMDIGYQVSTSQTSFTTTGNRMMVETYSYYSITNLPTEPTASITGLPPTTIFTMPTSAVLNTASSETRLRPRSVTTITTTITLSRIQPTGVIQSGSGSANSNLTWVIGPALGFVALLAILLLLWLYFRPRKQKGTKDPDEWLKRQPPSKTRLPPKSAMKPSRRSPSSLFRFFIYELPGSALPHELPGSTSMPKELQGSSPPPRSIRNLHGKGPEDVAVLEAVYVAAKSLAAEQIKEVIEIAPREKRKRKKERALSMIKEKVETQSPS